MNNFFDKVKNLSAGHLRDAAGMCAGFALLLLAAVFIAGGGLEGKSNLSMFGITPGSQTASVFPCSYFGDCSSPTQVHYGLQANVTTVTAGQPVTLTWIAYTDAPGGNKKGACVKNDINPGRRCSLSTVGDVGTPCNPTTVSVSQSEGGDYTACSFEVPPFSAVLPVPYDSVVVHPTQTITYSFCGSKYLISNNGGYTSASFPTPCPSVTITASCPAGYTGTPPNCTLPPVTCLNGLNHDAYPSCACPAGQTQSGASCITPAPTCTTDSWTCSGWGSCSAAGTQGRTCTNSGTCNTVPSPAVSQSCTPPATVVPTTLASFTANPSAVQSSKGTTLAWTGTKGTNYLACDLAGGQWGAGTWFTALPGSIATDALYAGTTYSMNCFDTDGSSTGWKSAAVTVAAPEEVDVCSNIPGVQTTIPANAHSDSGTCVANAGYQPDPSDPAVFIPVASCPGAHQTGTPPNCSCDVGFHWDGAACTQNMCSGANEAGWPACLCAAGFARDSGTNLCIREPVLSIAVNGQNAVRVKRGTQVVVTWSASGVTSESCSVKTNTGATIGSSDSGSVSNAVANQTTYRLTCTNEAGSVVSKEANATLVPDVIEQ